MRADGPAASLLVHNDLPTSVRRILIVGAGGFGREVLLWARDAWPEHAPKIAGFLSADPRRLEGHACRLPILADPAAFEPQPDDAFLLAIGIPGIRRTVAEQLLAKGGRFLTLVHPTAIVASSASIGTGSIICPHAIVSDAAHLGRFAVVNFNASLAHDASTGDFVVLSPYAALGGGAHVGHDVFLGLHAAVGPGKRIGDRSKVSANSAALTDGPPDCLIYGVPGQVGRQVSPQ